MILRVFIVLLVAATTFGQVKTTKATARVPQNVCSDAALKGFEGGAKATLDSIAVPLKGSPSMEIQLLVEDNIHLAPEIQLAAAEVINKYFSRQLVVVPSSQLVLYITGTNPFADTTAQSFTFAVQTWTGHPYKVGNKVEFLAGQHVLASTSYAIQGNDDYKTKSASAELYTVLSKFLAALQQVQPSE